MLFITFSIKFTIQEIIMNLPIFTRTCVYIGTNFLIETLNHTTPKLLLPRF